MSEFIDITVRHRCSGKPDDYHSCFYDGNVPRNATIEFQHLFQFYRASVPDCFSRVYYGYGRYSALLYAALEHLGYWHNDIHRGNFPIGAYSVVHENIQMHLGRPYYHPIKIGDFLNLDLCNYFAPKDATDEDLKKCVLMNRQYLENKFRKPVWTFTEIQKLLILYRTFKTQIHEATKHERFV